MSFDEEESIEHTLLVVREVSVYRIPPRSTSGGYKCGEWLQSDKIWSGRFLQGPLRDPRESSVEPALDSSRYFVLKIEDGNGKHAFIGLGFNERNEAFDFNVALSDHDKHVRWENEKETGETSENDSHIDIHPAVNHRLKEGETIQINVKRKPSSGTGMLSAAGLSGGKPKPLSLAPPPSGAGKIRSPLPPPPNDPVAARRTSSSQGPIENMKQTKPSTYFPQLERNVPATGSGSSKTTASGWAAF
ncbi:putative ribosome bioproteinsis protein nop10 [Hibiscus syriacus]|uniref:Ribosome bioproteinsis protein nop10 n=1 Tax=Hibiscus syriacus TaxID=106335 RepID=A0A6A3AE24_HIBSY|nr:putative ribosome bioproteinsis protein nop10 [Hibiscus syriacus]